MIRFPCGTCGSRLRVPQRLAGKRGRCEHCGAVNRVPEADVDHPPAGTPDGVLIDADTAAGTGDDGVVQVLEIPTPPEPADADTGADATPPFDPEPEPELDRLVEPEPEPAADEDEREIADAPAGPGDAGPAAEDEAVDRTPAPFEARPAFEDHDDVAPSSGVLWSAEEVPDDDAVPLADDGAESPPMEVVEITDAIPPQPEVVAVDVRRATGASPFRSTADVEARKPIEGTVEVPGARFAATTLTPTVGVPGDFLNEVAQRIADLPGSAAPPPPPGPEVRVLDVEVDDSVRSAAIAAAIPFPHVDAFGHAASHVPSQRSAVVTALLIGLVIGFCAGLMLSGWL